ncbi:diguanylate cyclase [Rubrobacter tropicus]|uniref:Diguanylate cyclase n=1 Tax=Rubrobacter tropicus TaxID=2653851 RepID=A0A6G8Q5L7_9ACTN|nr:diguanylate cyclase [Rubrobacter tropicus]QIN81617.1 diguanylate cyclase [Rubrobacter tropicus]
MKILVAEDDAVSRTILKRAVEKLGHECLVAEDGRSAWETFCAQPCVDVIISDWMMPDVDGLELCRMIREEERGARGRAYTYFIFLTALGDRDHLLMGLEAGADDYLSKPLDRDELGMRLISADRVTELHRKLAFQNDELENLNRMLFEQSRQDPLTRLGNRLRMREDLEVLQSRAERYGHDYAVVLCDVDFFKAYNDRYGHLAGDDALQKVSQTISASLRGGDTAYRYGGEEFLIVLPEQSVEMAVGIADRLRHTVEDLGIPHESNPPGNVVTISAGVAAFSSAGAPDDLLKEADAALYAAKRAGRNRVSTGE